MKFKREKEKAKWIPTRKQEALHKSVAKSGKGRTQNHLTSRPRRKSPKPTGKKRTFSKTEKESFLDSKEGQEKKGLITATGKNPPKKKRKPNTQTHLQKRGKESR